MPQWVPTGSIIGLRPSPNAGNPDNRRRYHRRVQENPEQEPIYAEFLRTAFCISDHVGPAIDFYDPIVPYALLRDLWSGVQIHTFNTMRIPQRAS